MHRNRIADLRLRGSTRPLPVRVYWPGQSARPAPLLVFCMVGDGGAGLGGGGAGLGGGGAGLGGGAEASCQELSSGAGLVVLSVSCDMAGQHDGTFVLEWAAEHAAELDADPGRLLVAGEGAGGQVAAAVTVAAWERDWPVLTGQVLINAGPISWPVGAGIAPATVVTVTDDPRGDGGRYAARLRRAGVAVQELRCTVPDLATGKMRTDLGRALRQSLGTAARHGCR